MDVTKYAICIHGGAGVVSLGNKEALAVAMEGLQAALKAGQKVLKAKGSATDAVEAACACLEDHPSFNAGRGAVYTIGGKIELEASIMGSEGAQCGAAALLTRVKNPIKLARKVMEATPHTFLAGPPAEEFAAAQGLEIVQGDPEVYFGTPSRKEQRARWLQLQEQQKQQAGGGAGSADDETKASAAGQGGAQHQASQDEIVQSLPQGTVGAVACDSQGRLAAATSTGGRTCKYDGRIGDTPVIGAGNFASPLVAVSGTGIGEQFQRHCVAHSVHARMAYGGQSMLDAVRDVVHSGHVLVAGDGGVIAVDSNWGICLEFNSAGMYRGCADHTGRFEVAV